MENTAWRGFARGKWSDGEIDVRDFIQRNYTPYEGDGAFLAPATEATAKLWEQVLDLSQKERAYNKKNIVSKLIICLKYNRYSCNESR